MWAADAARGLNPFEFVDAPTYLNTVQIKPAVDVVEDTERRPARKPGRRLGALIPRTRS